MTRVLVTGGTGFIGRRLVARLLEEGAEVHATGRRAERLASTGVPVHEAPLEEPERLATLVRELRPATVFHLAAATDRARAPSLVRPLLVQNALTTAALVEALAETPADGDRAVRLVVVGSAEDYGLVDPPWREEGPARPVSPYGLSKLVAGAIARYAVDAGAVATCVVRPAVVYGPGQAEGQFVPSLVAACLANRPFAMTAGEQRRDFIYVDDVVAGLLAARAPDAAGRTFNLATGVETELRALAERVRALVGQGALSLGALPYREHETMRQPLDAGAAAATLGWRAQVSLDDGLARTIASMRLALSTERAR